MTHSGRFWQRICLENTSEPFNTGNRYHMKGTRFSILTGRGSLFSYRIPLGHRSEPKAGVSTASLSHRAGRYYPTSRGAEKRCEDLSTR